MKTKLSYYPSRNYYLLIVGMTSILALVLLAFAVADLTFNGIRGGGWVFIPCGIAFVGLAALALRYAWLTMYGPPLLEADEDRFVARTLQGTRTMVWVDLAAIEIRMSRGGPYLVFVPRGPGDAEIKILKPFETRLDEIVRQLVAETGARGVPSLPGLREELYDGNTMMRTLLIVFVIIALTVFAASFGYHYFKP